MVLKGFYGILKSMSPHLAFTMITGVSKFTKTSIFSELNNLLDITLMKKYANICGITHEEFREHLENLTSNPDMIEFDNIYDEVIRWYNGYSWDGITRVINPFSLLSFLPKKDLLVFGFPVEHQSF